MGLCVLLRALRVLEEVPASWSTKQEKEMGVYVCEFQGVGGLVLFRNHGN